LKITKDQKIAALERIITAIFGRQESTITYKSHFKDHMDVTIECDVDDAMKVLTNLDIADIESWFFTDARKIDPKFFKFRNRPWEGYTEITLMLEPIYWKRVEELEKQLKELQSREKNAKKG